MKTMLILLVWAPLLLSAQSSDSVAIRHEAAGWATAQSREAFDAAIPRVDSEGVISPICRVTTLRVRGAIDTLEYGIRIVEECPTVGADGVLRDGSITGEFIVADARPLTDQLARQRLAVPSIQIAAAVSALRVKRLPLLDASQILRRISSLRLPPVPPTSIALDHPVYELVSATGLVTRAIEVTPAARGRAEKAVMALAQQIAARFGYDAEHLRYDASFWD